MHWWCVLVGRRLCGRRDRGPLDTAALSLVSACSIPCPPPDPLKNNHTPTPRPTPQALLPALPHLTHLSLCKNRELGDAQLAAAAVHLLGLRALDLRGTWVTHRGLAELTQLTALTRLALAPHVELRPEQAGVVAALTQLRGLTLSCAVYGGALMEAVGRLTGLKVGRVGGGEVWGGC